MSGQTRIEWADATWNPVTGCTRQHGPDAAGTAGGHGGDRPMTRAQQRARPLAELAQALVDAEDALARVQAVANEAINRAYEEIDALREEVQRLQSVPRSLLDEALHQAIRAGLDRLNIPDPMDPLALHGMAERAGRTVLDQFFPLKGETSGVSGIL